MTSGILTRIPLLLLPHTLAPQAMNTGTFLGTVIDPTGASIPEATVKIQRADPPFERQVTTDGTGNYIAPQVSVGNIRSPSKKPDFKRLSVQMF